MGLVFDHTECLLLPSVAATLSIGMFLNTDCELLKKLKNETHISISQKITESGVNYVFSGRFADLTVANTIIVNFIEDLRIQINKVQTSLLFQTQLIKEETETENMTRAKNLTSTEGSGIENAENAQIENNEYTQIEISCSNPGKKKIYNASPWKKRKSRFTRKENNKCRKKRKMLDDIQTENTENIQMENTENIQIEYRYSDPGKTKIQHGKTRESLDLPKKKKKKLCRKTRNLLERFQIKNTENIQIENTEENLQIENTENLPKENTENLQIENTENLQIENTENLQIENTEKNLQKEKNITWKTWRKKQLGIILQSSKRVLIKQPLNDTRKTLKVVKIQPPNDAQKTLEVLMIQPSNDTQKTLVMLMIQPPNDTQKTVEVLMIQPPNDTEKNSCGVNDTATQ
ncbi:unnamed protein product [Mytilus coruscus]|uniref:Uncharacterized protein n=1 Tax=Mytilus coruscus TaxID=42192 RepID=A0A6J8E7T8_MYTCO|nr:unnamed protein product [Mytilus coruscus]